jgi:hypothetical protein
MAQKWLTLLQLREPSRTSGDSLMLHRYFKTNEANSQNQWWVKCQTQGLTPCQHILRQGRPGAQILCCQRRATRGLWLAKRQGWSLSLRGRLWYTACISWSPSITLRLSSCFISLSGRTKNSFKWAPLKLHSVTQPFMYSIESISLMRPSCYSSSLKSKLSIMDSLMSTMRKKSMWDHLARSQSSSSLI